MIKGTAAIPASATYSQDIAEGLAPLASELELGSGAGAHVSLGQTVYRTLCIRLMHGFYQAGDILAIQEVADDLRISTMPVREALQRLVAQKGLEPMRNRSVRVPPMTLPKLQDLKQVRMLVEGQALEWAVPHLRPAQLQSLQQLADAIHVSRNDLNASLEFNRKFHFTIYAASQSLVSLGVIESLWLQTGPYLRAARKSCGLERVQIDEHHFAIVEALRQGDARKARTALEDDIAWAFDQVAKEGQPAMDVATP